MSDKEFWILVRAALIMFIRAIEQRYELNKKIFLGNESEK